MPRAAIYVQHDRPHPGRQEAIALRYADAHGLDVRALCHHTEDAVAMAQAGQAETIVLTRARADDTLCVMATRARASQPPLYELIEQRLDGTLADFIAEHRVLFSWVVIADEIRALTGVEVSGETLRRWFAGRITLDVTVS